jgi:hypothetical protein
MRKFVLVFLALFAACDLRGGRDPSEIEFTGPSDTWPSQAEIYATNQVYQAYKGQIDGPPPWSSPLSETLGQRGIDAFELLLRDISGGDKVIVRGYSDVLLNMRLRSDFNFCSGFQRSRIEDALRDAASKQKLWQPYNYHARQIDRICQLNPMNSQDI